MIIMIISLMMMMLTDIALSSESENASSKYLVDISYKLG